MSHNRIYDAMFAVMLMVIGWLWQRDISIEAQMHQNDDRIRSELLSRAADRWTGSQQQEFKNRIDERYLATDERLRNLEKFHADQVKCGNGK
jgi:hypothetical protein